MRHFGNRPPLESLFIRLRKSVPPISSSTLYGGVAQTRAPRRAFPPRCAGIEEYFFRGQCAREGARAQWGRSRSDESVGRRWPPNGEQPLDKLRGPTSLCFSNEVDVTFVFPTLVFPLRAGETGSPI